MFDAGEFVKNAVEEIKSKVKGKAVIAVSGGVDSTVAAKLGSMALGENLYAVYVDTGLMRAGESDYVRGLYERMDLNFIFVDAKNEFLEALKGVVDPEEKRRIIGEKFIRIFERVAKEKKAEHLIQGTIAPDWIESGGGLRDTIKSHHNVAGLPKWLNLKVIEPLKYLYKDEVRALALSLGVPWEIAYRHPFPGPGLAVRIIGEITEEKLEIARKAAKIVEEELRKAGLYYKVWQAFTVVGDDKWVGVKGDRRAVGYIVIVRIVESEDGMTADWSLSLIHI